MNKIVILSCFAALCATVNAKAISVSPFAYSNSPLYAAGGSSQLDVRNNYDGTLSSYSTAPFNYAGPFASRYVANPYAPSAVLSAPLSAAHALAPQYAANRYAAYAGLNAYASPYTAAGPASPYAAVPASPFAAASPFASPYAAPSQFPSQFSYSALAPAAADH